MRAELTELEEQEVAEALKCFMDRPVPEGCVIHHQFHIWLEDKFGDWDVDRAVLYNYAECFCFANRIHPNS